jgi:RNA polymerase sigma factor (TIGR02999 family)
MIRLGVLMASGERIVVEVSGARKGSDVVRHTANQLTTELYAELHRSAYFQLGKHRRHETLRPTALVSEVFLRFASDPTKLWDRQHFMVTACKAMQQVIVDHARARMAAKRNGGQRPFELNESDLAEQARFDHSLERALAVNEVLDCLAARDELAATVVRLRFFAGMQPANIVAMLGLSESTIRRSFVFGKAWLERELIFLAD